ncbi:hypothetical protein WME95_11825 [Sorangium sp. So ce327]|uniref:hypothetical protein n=1 Tax=Sorangium sp. So ce327 TaxID=3133301 RepID=UPI003F63A846
MEAEPVILRAPLEHRADDVAVRVEPSGYLVCLYVEERRKFGDVERCERARDQRYERRQPLGAAVAERRRHCVPIGAWTWPIDRRPGEFAAERRVDLVHAEPVD